MSPKLGGRRPYASESDFASETGVGRFFQPRPEDYAAIQNARAAGVGARDVIDAVASVFYLRRRQDIFQREGRKWTEGRRLARRTAMFILHTDLGKTHAEIAKVLKLKTLKTSHLQCRYIEARLQKDANLVEKIKEVRACYLRLAREGK